MLGKVKSGKELLDQFFGDIEKMENVDPEIAQMLARLYSEDKLTDTAVKNELQALRDTDGNKN